MIRHDKTYVFFGGQLPPVLSIYGIDFSVPLDSWRSLGFEAKKLIIVAHPWFPELKASAYRMLWLQTPST